MQILNQVAVAAPELPSKSETRFPFSLREDLPENWGNLCEKRTKDEDEPCTGCLLRHTEEGGKRSTAQMICESIDDQGSKSIVHM